MFWDEKAECMEKEEKEKKLVVFKTLSKTLLI